MHTGRTFDRGGGLIQVSGPKDCWLRAVVGHHDHQTAELPVRLLLQGLLALRFASAHEVELRIFGGATRRPVLHEG